MDSLGSKLKSAREKLGLSVEEVSAKTKIRPHIIKSFEEDDFTVLPAVYAKSFVKTYAQHLKISDAEIVDQYREAFKSIPQQAAPILAKAESFEQSQSESYPGKPNRYKTQHYKDSNRNVVNYLVYTGLGLVLVVLIYFTFFSDTSGGGSSVPDENRPDTTVIKKTESKGLLSIFEGPDSLILEARALDTAWMRIDIDGKNSEVIHMVPNIAKRWSAENYFLLTVGNVGSVEFKRNGSVLPPFGPKGSVVRNVKITLNEIINSSSPWTEGDTTRIRRSYKKKEEQQPPPKILEPSTIEPYKPFEREKKEGKKPG